ncbi:serine/threonine protein kinase [Dictyobacter arantiisoli]|uniref:non-specific serine/threonine protein kinase n=1 Tax=Dictyobacter arantiisoli TaxID=2014874 RepID=A0A5A5T769_9CHLR|nr:serine/threonine-protein kinase [Dictyobacter arantiisoli]GCF07228.1 hypothetical protein KDI_07920 [Dictyobacter arantiisoli]
MQQLEQVTMGRYHILRRLARGGMADIYLARDVETDQVVAVKLVNVGAGEYYERFRSEVKAQAALKHEHILPVLDDGEFDSWYYLVMPYIEHGTLSERIKKGTFSLDEADQVLAQLAQALQYAHDKGIVHRDIKPSNVLMQDGTHAYLADFGLVKRVGEDNGLTLTGFLIGTPEYMAPELAEQEATPCSDVYALGVLLYQMLTGRVPFKGNTPIAVYLRHIRDIPEPPSLLNPLIPSEVEQVIIRALEKDPQKRFQSASDLYQAYARALALADERRRGLESIVTQAVHLSYGRPRVAIVQQKHRVFRGRFLFTMFLLPFLLVTIPILFYFCFNSNGWNSTIKGANAAPPSIHLQHVSSSPASIKPTVLHHPSPTPTAPPKKRVSAHATSPLKTSHYNPPVNIVPTTGRATGDEGGNHNGNDKGYGHKKDK